MVDSFESSVMGKPPSLSRFNRDVVEARRVDMIEVLLDAGVIIGNFKPLWANTATVVL